MKILNILRCIFTTHDISETDEDEVFRQQYFYKVYTKCIRCGTPVNIWIEPNCKEDEYIIQEF